MNLNKTNNAILSGWGVCNASPPPKKKPDLEIELIAERGKNLSSLHKRKETLSSNRYSFTLQKYSQDYSMATVTSERISFVFRKPQHSF